MRSFHIRTAHTRVPYLAATPVLPKPPAPRAVSSRSATSTTSGVAMRSMMSCAMRSPFLTAWHAQHSARQNPSVKKPPFTREQRAGAEAQLATIAEGWASWLKAQGCVRYICGGSYS